MPIKPATINLFLLGKLPSAFFCGVRLVSITDIGCVTSVKHRWINQNPFKSMFWAVQGMAAELSTGTLILKYIKENNLEVSMLVATMKATFLKKAKGRIIFSCNQGYEIYDVIDKAVKTGEGQTCWMRSDGIDMNGEVVSKFEFEWTVKLKK